MTIRYEDNPFLKDLEIKVETKNASFRTIKKDFIDVETGEVVNARLTKRMTVDREKFIKIFSGMVGHMLELNSAGTKALGFLLWVLQHNKPGSDKVRLDNMVLGEFSKEHEFVISRTVLTKGIMALEDRRIIAKTSMLGYYWINPSFIFNGDRVVLTQIIEQK